MPSNLILVTEVPVTAAHLDKAAAAWQQHLDDHAQTGHQLYRNLQADTLLELTAVTDEVAELAALRQSWKDLWPQLADYLTGDYRRQLLHHVESPKPSAGSLPAGKYLQLRHIEVLPAGLPGLPRLARRDHLRRRPQCPRGQVLRRLPLGLQHRARGHVRVQLRHHPAGV